MSSNWYLARVGLSYGSRVCLNSSSAKAFQQSLCPPDCWHVGHFLAALRAYFDARTAAQVNKRLSGTLLKQSSRFSRTLLGALLRVCVCVCSLEVFSASRFAVCVPVLARRLLHLCLRVCLSIRSGGGGRRRSRSLFLSLSLSLSLCLSLSAFSHSRLRSSVAAPLLVAAAAAAACLRQFAIARSIAPLGRRRRRRRCSRRLQYCAAVSLRSRDA